jgi:hypothetical protein
VQTAGEKNLSTGIRFKQVLLKGFLRLDLQPVQLIFPTSITDQKNPPVLQGYYSEEGAAAAAFSSHYYLLRT